MFREIGNPGRGGQGRRCTDSRHRHGPEIDNSAREAACVSSWITVRNCFRFRTCTVCAGRPMERWGPGHGRVVFALRL